MLQPGSIIRVPQPWYVDPALRLGGAGLIALAVGAILLLVSMVRTIPFHPATAAELGLAAAAVLGASGGSVMLWQGARMFDRVVIAKSPGGWL
ncbi:hypothetical protein [Croceibacterium xixiisoli]|nr:hypothetical protein [Croceibacterium xixiisoli]